MIKSIAMKNDYAELTTMPATILPDQHSQLDCRPAKFSCDKDRPFEPEPENESHSVITSSSGLKAAKSGGLRLRVSTAGFLTALVLMLVASPFVRGLKHGQVYVSVLFTLVMCTGLVATGSCRRLALALMSLPLAAIWLNQLWPQKCSALTFILPAIAFLAVVTASMLRFILRAKRVDAEVLCAGVSVYLILGLLWGLAYTFTGQIDPKAFSFTTRSGTAEVMSGFTAVYFSFTTLTTLGYGDITPVTDVARMLAMLEAMTGTLFVGVMIARLVSLYTANAHRQMPAPVEGENHGKDFQCYDR